MIKSKMTAGLVVMAFAFAAAVTPALAVNEFSGKSIKTTGGEVVFFLSGASVTCTTSSGKGGVLSKAQAKIEVTFEKCTAIVGEATKAIEAKVTTCGFNFKPEDSVTLESGCVIEFKILFLACIITPSTTENAGLKEVGYFNLKEKGTLESEMLLGVNGLTYTVNKACEAGGVKGKVGELASLAPVVAQGVVVRNVLKFIVKASVPAEERKVATRSTDTHTIKFLNTNKIVRCLETNFFGSAAANETEFLLLTSNIVKYTTCKTNILAQSEESAAVETSAGCKFEFAVLSNAPATPQRGGFFSEPAGCQLTIKVMTCTVTIPQIAAYVNFANTAGTPKTVKVRFSEGQMPVAQQTLLSYTTNGNCTGLPARGVASYKGESKIGAETLASVAVDVEIG